MVAQLEARLEVWQEVNSTLTINDIEDFASQIMQRADEFGFPPLKSWAQKLADQASMFDLAAMPDQLGEYTELIEEAKALC